MKSRTFNLPVFVGIAAQMFVAAAPSRGALLNAHLAGGLDGFATVTGFRSGGNAAEAIGPPGTFDLNVVFNAANPNRTSVGIGTVTGVYDALSYTLLIMGTAADNTPTLTRTYTMDPAHPFEVALVSPDPDNASASTDRPYALRFQQIQAAFGGLGLRLDNASMPFDARHPTPTVFSSAPFRQPIAVGDSRAGLQLADSRGFGALLQYSNEIYDNATTVQFTAVPEPAGLSLLAIGAAVLRRRKAHFKSRS